MRLAGADTIPARPRRWAHWPPTTDSPYFGLFYGALRPHGVVPVAGLQPRIEWLETHRVDAVHVHWPEGLWRHRRRGLIRRTLGLGATVQLLRSARERGMVIVWTVHNRSAHEGVSGLDRLGYRAVAKYASLIICHSQLSVVETQAMYRPSATLLVVPHGNMNGVYPPPRARDTVLNELGLDPRRPVVSCLGYLRRYKGLEVAAAAVSKLGNEVQLIIGGPPYKEYDLAPLRRALAAHRHTRLFERRLTDQEFADVTAASDASLLPYSEVTTSSALMASWTLGTGAVASDLPFFREATKGTGDAAMLFKTGDETELALTIARYLAIPVSARRAAARAAADHLPWSRCVAPVVEWLDRDGARDQC